ncbi:MAG: terpene cyclase/mutase family protein [Pirellulales bacterium]
MSSDSSSPLEPQGPALPGLGGAAPGGEFQGHPVPPLPPVKPLAAPKAAPRPTPRAAPPVAKPGQPAKPMQPVGAKPRPFPAAKPIEQVYVAQVVAAPEPTPVAKSNVPSHADGSLTPGRAGGDFFRGSRKLVVATLGSMIAHCVLVIVLALMTSERPQSRTTILVASADRVIPKDFVKLDSSAAVKPTNPGMVTGGVSPSTLARSAISAPTLGAKHEDKLASNSTTRVTLGNFGHGELLTPVGGSPYGMLDGRDGELKQHLLGDGSSDASELAVARGLRWLAAHQRADGSWHFNHLQDGGVCKYCRNPGTHGSTTAATGLALLPFLGAGQTHQKGEYQETVRKGLEFLVKRAISTPLGADLQDGVNLYSQAIATLALCEAYALTRDPSLMTTCRESIRFIVNAQDKNGGGWRYFPGQIGDTTVTGWMLMALKSGQLTYMPIQPDVWIAAKRYLDGVQDDSGAAYGYQGPTKGDATMTAIGLLCRMYGGWPRSQAALARGIRTLSKRGPSEHDLYYNYYATQVLRHYGGPEWTDWNLKMRDYLVETQAKEGHASGSWYFADKHGDQGGRIYNTAMSLLILEVYYRHLPIYGHRVLGDGYR